MPQAKKELLLIVDIGCVDGVTGYTIQTDSASVALHFLRRYDHEGSSISMKTDSTGPWETNAETVYRFLEAQAASKA